MRSHSRRPPPLSCPSLLGPAPPNALGRRSSSAPVGSSPRAAIAAPRLLESDVVRRTAIAGEVELDRERVRTVALPLPGVECASAEAAAVGCTAEVVDDRTCAAGGRDSPSDDCTARSSGTAAPGGQRWASEGHEDDLTTAIPICHARIATRQVEAMGLVEVGAGQRTPSCEGRTGVESEPHRNGAHSRLA